MIGDRIDNDIVPARTLGMTTIRFVSGRHSKQQPRSGYEAPNADVRSVQELRTAIKAIISNPPDIFVDTGPE
jgi:putative hydrolase of the HAD superfamily